MRIFLFILVTFIAGAADAQVKDTTSSTGFKPEKVDVNQKILQQGKNYDVNFDISNHEAFFLEGEDSLFRFLYSRITIPKEALDANISATAMVSFQVGFDGKISGGHSISKVGYGIDEQLIDLLSKLEFVAATQSDMAYRSEVMLEIPVKAVYLFNVYKH